MLMHFYPLSMLQERAISSRQPPSTPRSAQPQPRDKYSEQFPENETLPRPWETNFHKPELSQYLLKLLHESRSPHDFRGNLIPEASGRTGPCNCTAFPGYLPGSLEFLDPEAVSKHRQIQGKRAIRFGRCFDCDAVLRSKSSPCGRSRPPMC